MNRTEQELKELMPILKNEIHLANSLFVFLKELNKIVGKINEFSSHQEMSVNIEISPKKESKI